MVDVYYLFMVVTPESLTDPVKVGVTVLVVPFQQENRQGLLHRRITERGKGHLSYVVLVSLIRPEGFVPLLGYESTNL